MDNQQLVGKIEADTKALMTLKVDNEELVKDKFRSIGDRIDALRSSAAGDSDSYLKAFDLLQAAMTTEFKQFDESASYDEKGKALIQLRHKAAEICEILRSHA